MTVADMPLPDTLRMSASAHYVAALAEVLDEFGFPREDSLSICGTTRRAVEQDPSARIGLDCVCRMFGAAQDRLGDPQIGLRAGHRFRIAGYGKTGSIYAYADDLADVVALNARYQRLAVDMGRIGLEVAEDGQAVCFDPYYSDRMAYRHLSAMLMGAYVTAFRWLSWSSGQELVRVDMPYPEPADGGALARKLLRCPARFGARTGRLVLSHEAMAEPLPLSDAEKRARTIAQLDAMMGASDARQSFHRAVRGAMRGGLEAGRLTLPMLAERMEMSEKTLRARLREAGLTYRGELDGVRQSLTVELMERGESFASIAGALGYNDQAAFNRAFRRWHGMSPGQWTPPDRRDP
ncbi:MAG: AraC family transcriptional regulator ligand-binding domain-containing protein [Litorimonas sp.]